MPTPKTIITAQVITASGNEAGGHSSVADSLSVQVNVTAVSGTTPSLTVSVAWSNDGVTYGQANPVDALAAITTVTGLVARFTVKGAYYQIAWTVSGTTPSFTATIATFN